MNGCGDVHSSCLERWTKVKKLTVLMRTQTSNLLIFRSDVLPLGHRDSTMSYAILRTIVDTHLTYSFTEKIFLKHFTVPKIYRVSYMKGYW